ncbi:hypothetical protein [Paenibacillus xylaniclasticus]|uniref:hypothetical protein n=1 Tax=Paenibacillus xylaniclasticus TaxID=588083 RepID=UPI000FD74AD0|nr:MULTISPECIES: hypothetical protein [Paenibacillus]GFN32201.1 hypothetical protein PCURB6_24610 [Paenibacillus curdlanolyticus]
MGDNWTPIYGDFDCEANAVAYWLHENGLSQEAFIQYNWDFYYDEDEELLRGCIQVPQLIEFLRAKYELSVTELTFDDLPVHELVIIPGNAYWLPYAADYYLTQRLVHYYPACKASDGTIKVWDPIFSNMGGEVKEYVLRKAFEELDRTALRLQRKQLVVPKEQLVPHILSTDYEASYRRAVEQVLPRVYELLGRQGDLRKDLDYKRYFGNLQSILIGRERYFQTVSSSLADSILNAWRNVVKRCMRLSYLRQEGWEAFVNSITQAIKTEIIFLRGLTNSN